MKKNICFFCSMPSFDTGMPISTYKLIEHFSYHNDYNVSVILPQDGELAERVRQCGIEPLIVSFSRFRSPRRFREFAHFVRSFPAAFFRTIHHFKHAKIDLVHFSDIIDMPFYACAVCAGVASITHVRYCITNTPGRLVFNLFARLCLKKVICISNAVKRYSGLPDSFACVVYNPGPDMTLFNPNRSCEQFLLPPDNRSVILAIGKFVQAKGHEHFVDMATNIESRYPGKCRYVIIGDSIPGRTSFKEYVTALIHTAGLDDAFTIIANVKHEQIPAVFAQTAVFVLMPNCQEGLGGVVLEAMAMKVPVVAFDSGGIGECFSNITSGFLVPQGDTQAAADAVILLIQNPEVRNTLGTHARDELLSRFTYEKHFSGIEAVYTSLLR